MLGLIGRKVGMTQVFDENGALVPSTVIVFEPNFVVGKRTTFFQEMLTLTRFVVVTGTVVTYLGWMYPAMSSPYAQ